MKKQGEYILTLLETIETIDIKECNDRQLLALLRTFVDCAEQISNEILRRYE